MEYSVLMSVYKKEKAEFLKEAIESIQKQSKKTDDFVLVCDGELNESLDKVILDKKEEMGDVLNVIRLKENVGLGKALNVGLEYCKNEYIARMDSDDISVPDRCEKQLEIFKKLQEISICSGTVQEFSDDINNIECLRILPQNNNEIIKFSKKRNPFNHPCVMYKKSSVKAVGSYQDFYLLEDYHLWIRMLMNGYKGYNLEDILLNMRAGNNMYKRRAGFKYVLSQIRLFKYMKENKYDDERFFGQYSQMSRSVQGLRGAGEWHELKKMLPDFNGKRVLDLGCGFGWHCRYAIERGATFALGIDLSGKMLDKAREINPSPLIEYKRIAIEDFDFAPNSFDIVISSLTFHYLESFDTVCTEVYKCLTQEGVFVFSVEHPVFTAYGNQDWIYDSEGKPAHWPVDHYFQEGIRHARFLGEDVTKYHKTLTTYVNGLIKAGFCITHLVEPQPDESMLDTVPGMRDELRRPMMLLIAARKN